MKNDRELVIAMAEAEKQLTETVAGIMQAHGLPCFLMECVLDKIHHRLIEGKASELESARAREASQKEAKS